MKSFYILPLVWQLFGPSSYQTSYTVGEQWAVPFGAYTSGTKTMWFGEAAPFTQFRWARFLVVWSPNSCAGKVRLIARDAMERLPQTELGRVEACSPNERSATAERIYAPNISVVDITQILNKAITTYPDGFYLVYEMNDDGQNPIGFWEVRIEGWLKLHF